MVEDGGGKGGKQKKMSQEEVDELLAIEKKKWQKAKKKEIKKAKAATGRQNQQRPRGPGPCYLCQGQHHIKDCPDMARLRQNIGSSSSTGQGN